MRCGRDEYGRHLDLYYQEVVDCSFDLVDFGLTESLDLDKFPTSRGVDKLGVRMISLLVE